MSLPAVSARRPVTVAMFFVAVVLVGLVSLGRLPIELLPDVAYPRLVIHTEEPGGAPSEIERSITEPLERAVASVAGVRRIESVTREGVSLVTIRFAWGTDMDFAALNVRERLDNARAALPVTASPSVVLRTDPRGEPILSVSVSGRADLLTLKEMADQVFKRRLEQLDGVARAAVTGGLEREIHVDVEPRQLESYGLTIGDIATALAAANAAGQGGTVLQGRYRYSLRTIGEFTTPEEIGAVALRVGGNGAGTGSGSLGGADDRESGVPGGVGAASGMILLRDVATITDGVKERTSIARFRMAGDATGAPVSMGEGEGRVEPGSGIGSGLVEGPSGGAPEGASGGAGAFGAPRLNGIAPGTAPGSESRAASGIAQSADAVGILVFKTSEANTVRVADLVEETLAQLRAEYPDIRLEIAMSQAGFISDAISNVLSALVLGGVLAFLVLFLFLRDPRYPVAIAIAIPISVIGTFALLDALGISLNIMTLGGLALGVGLLVDNSIVVLENIFRRRELGEPMFTAAILGTEEVIGAITASTLTAVAVFGPIVYVEGIAGELFGALSLAVAFSLLISLLVAMTVLPAMAGSWTDDDGEGRGDGGGRRGSLRGILGAPFALIGRGVARVSARPLAAFDRAFDWFTRYYHRLLLAALAHRGRSIGISVALLVLALAGAAFLPRGVLPDVDQGAFRVRVELDRGTPIERTLEVAERLEDLLLADRGVAAVFTQVGRADALVGAEAGSDGLHTATLEARLAPGAATGDVVTRLRAALGGEEGRSPALSADDGRDGARALSAIPTTLRSGTAANAAGSFANSVGSSANSVGSFANAMGIPVGAVTIETSGTTALGGILGGAESDIAVRVSADDLDAALAYAGDIARGLAAVESLGNVRVGTELGQPEIRVEIDREATASYGLDPRAVADAIESAMRGTEATQFADFDRRVPVVVRLPDAQREDLATLDEVRVRGVPVTRLVRLHTGLGPAEIHRLDQARVVPVFADAAGASLGTALTDAQTALAELPPPAGLRFTVGGENEEMRRSFRDLGFAFILAVLLIYMILAAQFESFVHPFTILLSVPMALIGVVWALGLTGGGLNTMSLIGMVIMVGIAVNNAIVMVDVMIRLRREGHPVREAVIEAGHTRLRPIVMNTMANMLGLLPMAIGIGSGADLRAPLAVTLIGGLAVSTLLTLVVIPVVFEAMERASA